MSVEQTLSIIKPDGVEKNLIGEIYRRFESAGLSIVAARMLHLSQEQAEGFYAVHKERPFYADLVRYMTSGPVVVQVLEGENAVETNRRLMGATNPADAEPGNDPCGLRGKYRRKCRSRVGRSGYCGTRNRVFLRGRRLSAHPLAASKRCLGPTANRT